MGSDALQRRVADLTADRTRLEGQLEVRGPCPCCSRGVARPCGVRTRNAPNREGSCVLVCWLVCPSSDKDSVHFVTWQSTKAPAPIVPSESVVHSSAYHFSSAHRAERLQSPPLRSPCRPSPSSLRFL